jgi:predicted DNA-binding protein (UPF0251 family)
MENNFNTAAEAEFASNPDVQALLRMEPGKETSSSEPEAASTPVSGEGQPPSSAEVSATPAAPAAAPATAQVDPEIERMKGFYKALEATMYAQPTPQPMQQPAAPQQPELPQYAYDVNDQLLRAITSDDLREREAALKAFAVNLSQTVHMRALEQARQEVAQAVPVFVQHVIATEFAKRQIASDFYGKFPELNTPEIAPIVGQVAQQVMGEMGASTWTPKVRDAVGARVKSMLSAVAGQVQQQAPAPVMTTPAATPMVRNNPENDMLSFIGLR